ncbi:MAG: Efflux transport system, outer membrane factor (OMF) lipoprotein [uncultured Rubellimicrobium sp.]|uniref:Efflux transport system, outer membrane factor (OMF) lipoprotein n=1 Tax=uncultured Rubellimicrobium sp. TaxID=543078 RepID=A0A6J4Q7E0_9RHOB|nr:MAG: Efflux transport system, outer membrane factor (OMF) lipoprotein [uncultured Rubellimicrobium sp.]
MTKLSIIALLSSALPLIACSPVGPEFRGAQASVPASYVEGGATVAGDLTMLPWWRDLQDARLTSLLERGLAQSLDIQAAMARVAEAEATLRGTGGADLATGDLVASVVRVDSEGASASTRSTAGVSGSLVLDLFGGRLRQQQQAQAELDARRFDVGTARLAVLASVAGNYIDARYFQEALALTRRSIETRRQTLALVQEQRNLGEVTELEVAQAEAGLNLAQADLPALEAAFLRANYAIATLLAAQAGPIIQMMTAGAPQPNPPSSDAVGVPADLLRNRPDVRAAERELAAAVSAVGVAEAALYPSINLSGNVTVGDSESWSFGPTLSIPLLNRPVLAARRDAAVARVQQAEIEWRRTVLAAVEEVQSAQSTFARSRQRLAAQQRAVASYTQLVDLSREAYQLGTTTLFALLDAERSLADAQISAATARRDVAADWLALQIAAGKGWAVR